MLHLDLFSGIGGFALAADRVWDTVEHVFCDNEPFAQEVLKKHWPESYIYKDIRHLTANAERERHFHGQPKELATKPQFKTQRKSLANISAPFILTGGFPCQPFSQAGRRKGEADDRFLWPEMCRVIGEFKPTWVIAENVRGLLTQGGGVVFERVCTDLESLGYEVQPIVIPAVVVNAPHRRDRVWFIAHYARRTDGGYNGSSQARQRTESRKSDGDSDATDTRRKRRSTRPSEGMESSSQEPEWKNNRNSDWDTSWFKVATRLCRVDDGLPKRMDRNPRLKALGNAIVPQVAEQIMRAISKSVRT